jgi:hypothetical protein
MTLAVPESGLPFAREGSARIREAKLDDVSAMVELEQEVSGIRRPKDYRCFIENRMGIWHTSVIENLEGSIDGFLVSIHHPGSTMIGPGVMQTDVDAAALVLAELNHLRGSAPACLIPAGRAQLVKLLYEWGLRNTELALFQCRGIAEPFRGVAIPTFMPETG